MNAVRRVLGAIPARYLLSKVVLALALLWGVATLIFFLVELSPGSVVDKFISPDIAPEQRDLLIKRYGLDQPVATRYFLMLTGLVGGDLGLSLVQERPVTTIIWEALPNTLLLSGVTLVLLYPISIAIGTMQAVFQGRMVDTATSITALTFYSMPVFWLALMLQLAAPSLGLPSSGMHDAVMYDYMSPAEQRWDLFLHLILPALAMGLASSAAIVRYMRSSLLEVIRQDFVRTARAKGLPERVVILRHALGNAMLPIITLIGLSLPRLVGGSILVETVFAWPGMGRLIIDAIMQQDTPLIIGCFLLFGVVVAIGNLLADVLYAVADPRISYQ
jgi:peptide/nickel transport system permease protein